MNLGWSKPILSRETFLFCLLFLIIFLAIEVGVVVFKVIPVTDGQLINGDSYLHLVRATGMHGSTNWFDGSIPRGNAPYGEVSYWTLPFEMLLLAGAWVLTPFLGFKSALFWFGALVSPLLLLGTAIALVWAVAPIFDRDRRLILVAALMLQPMVMFYSFAGTADHHAFLFLTYTICLGFLIRLVLRPYGIRLALVTGVSLGMGLWFSIELALILGSCFAATSLLWMLRGGDCARKNLGFSLGLAATVAVAIIAERPLALFFQDEYDRISVVHLFIALVATGFWSVVRVAESRNHLVDITGRVVMALLGMTAAAVLLFLVFPKFFGGPWVDIDPELIRMMWSERGGVQSLWPTSGRALVLFLTFLGPSLVIVPFLGWLLWHDRKSESWPAWLMVGVSTLLSLLLGLSMFRIVAFAEILIIISLVELLIRFRSGFRWKKEQFVGRLVLSLASVLLFVGFAIAGQVVNAAISTAEPPKRQTGRPICRISDLTPTLNNPEGLGARRRTILTTTDLGPELLYRTNHATVGSPNHRNAAGIIDTIRVLGAAEDMSAHRIIERRGVDLVLLCRKRAGRHVGQNKTEFHRRLLNGDLPSWIRKVELPPQAGDWRLYEVIR